MIASLRVTKTVTVLVFGPHSCCLLVRTDQDTFQVFQLQWSGPITSGNKASAGCEASSRQPTAQTDRSAHAEEACQQKMASCCFGVFVEILVGWFSEKRPEIKAPRGQMEQPSPESKLEFVRMV